MTRALLLLTLALLAPPALATPCPPIERSAGPPVYVILYGYPYGSPYAPPPDQGGLPDLSMIDEDLIAMGRFFEALGPAQMHVHGEPTPALIQHFSAFGVRPPTWRDLLGSVWDVIEAIDYDPEATEPAEVYIYIVGHGVRTGGTAGKGGGRLAFFGRGEASAEGTDGVMHSVLVADHILAPLADRARVHLIADTCSSYAMLQTRGMRLIKRVIKAPPREELAEAFMAAFPHVGAHLAARTGAYESRARGGHFSHAVRSFALGAADRDVDGIVTYGEMASALERAKGIDWKLDQTTVVPPGGDPDTPFIHWRRSPATRVCLAPGAAPSALWDGSRPFATFDLGATPKTLWLAPSGGFRVIWPDVIDAD